MKEHVPVFQYLYPKTENFNTTNKQTMGVTIHFRGSLDDKNRVHELMEEVTDICESMDWEYNLLDEDWEKVPNLAINPVEDGAMGLDGHAGLKGILFCPNPDCEVVSLTFTSEGHLNSLMNLATGQTKEEDGKPPWVFTKTQFAGAEAHVSIVKLLKYLKQKYMSDLEVEDEGNFWDTGDFNQVETRMKVIKDAMTAIESSLSELKDIDPSELTKDAILKKIESVIKKLSEEQGLEMKVLRIDQVFEDKGINLDFDFDDHDIDDPSLN